MRRTDGTAQLPRGAAFPWNFRPFTIIRRIAPPSTCNAPGSAGFFQKATADRTSVGRAREPLKNPI